MVYGNNALLFHIFHNLTDKYISRYCISLVKGLINNMLDLSVSVCGWVPVASLNIHLRRPTRNNMFALCAFISFSISCPRERDRVFEFNLQRVSFTVFKAASC